MKTPSQTALATMTLIAAISFGTIFTAVAADLTVEMTGTGDKGNVMVALYRAEDKWLGKPFAGNMAVAHKDGVKLVFKDVATGEYGLSLFVDENSNGKMDSNAAGIPIEPYAFSNDAFGNFGPPKFEQAKFKVEKDHKTILITFK